jgi:hypothetical protein
MYVKTTSRRNKDGQTVRYLQLAHNEWDPVAGRSRTKVLHSFGREDELDREAIGRLVGALSKLLDPAAALSATGSGNLSLISSRPWGGVHALDGLWHRLGLNGVVHRQLAGRRLDPRVERVLFALVANRALAASSKLAATEWIAGDVHIEGLEAISDEACYRAMDYLLTIEPALAKEAYFQVTDLLNLEVDLLFFDTTSTYFQTEDGDEPVARDARGDRLPDDAPAEEAVRHAGFRTHGKSKDSREDLPQVVIGMAVTRDGIPVRVWSWPGNTGDQALIRQVRGDLREWTLSKVVWVADRGFTSAANRRALIRGGGGYIIGEKLRTGSDEVRAALSRQGRYATVRDNLQVKEVNIGSDDRFVICFNPDQAARDAAIRERMVTQLNQAIEGTDKLTRSERDRLAGVLSTKPGLKRFLRTTPGRPAAGGQEEDRRRGQPRREVSPALLRPEAVGRGHRPGLQAAPRNRTRLARHEADPGPAARLPPPRGPHPRPCPAVLARPPADPRRGDLHRPDLEPSTHRAPAPARRHLQPPGRHLPPVHRPDQAPARHLHRPRRHPAQEDHRSERRPLTRHYPTA